MPTRQTSSSGRPKSPRIQVVLPEELCERLASLAESESRTVSNMARVLIQQGIERLEHQRAEVSGDGPPDRSRQRPPSGEPAGRGPRDQGSERRGRAQRPSRTERFREALERQGQQPPPRRRPRRLRIWRPA